MASQDSASIEMCAGVKRLGYAARQRIKLHGEEFELLSDPFPEAGGIAVHAKVTRTADVRVLQLPTTIVQAVKGLRLAA